MMMNHMERHATGVYIGDVPRSWLEEQGKYICHCKKLVSEFARNSHQSKCTSRPQANETPDRAMPSLDEVFSLQKPTLKRIPAAARQCWGRVLQNEINHAVHENTVEAFTSFLMLPKCVLPSAKRAGAKITHRVDIQTLCNRWSAGKNACLGVTKIVKQERKRRILEDSAESAAGGNCLC